MGSRYGANFERTEKARNNSGENLINYIGRYAAL